MQIYSKKEFINPVETVAVFTPEKIRQGLDRIEELRNLGLYLVGYMRYDLGRADEKGLPLIFFEAYAGYGAELTLSGHLHGGLVRIPVPVSKKAKEAGAHIMRGVFSPRLRFFPKYDAGRFDIDGRTMIVSRGLGSHTLPIRVFNPGDLVVIDLKPPGGV